jgi:thiol-disulfide isomerase/thioredoxin
MKNLLRLVLLLPLLTAGLAQAEPVHAKGPAPLRIAHGEVVNLSDYLVPGKTVIFDFTSEYCPPCRGYDGPLKLLHAQRDDLVVVQVDINRPGVRRIDWKSPVAQQFALHSIPRFAVYGPDGRLVAEDKGREGGSPAREMVDRWINGLSP